MSDDPVLKAVQKFMDAVEERLTSERSENETLRNEMRTLRDELQTRSVQVVEGPRGKDGANGIDGKDGRDGKDGTDGKPGERGNDGIATRAEFESIVEERFTELQVRTIADAYQGVYQPEKDYSRGMLTTWGGSLFLALANTRARPEVNGDWRLIVKRGADGKK